MVGPNSAMAVGSLVPVVEAQADYLVACISKIQRQRIKTMVVRKEAVDDFQRFLDAYFPRTVFARKVTFPHPSPILRPLTDSSVAAGTSAGMPTERSLHSGLVSSSSHFSSDLKLTQTVQGLA